VCREIGRRGGREGGGEGGRGGPAVDVGSGSGATDAQVSTISVSAAVLEQLSVF